VEYTIFVIIKTIKLFFNSFFFPSSYQLRSEFVTDAILVFDNCQLFNEDESEVGQCGHNMREFFTRRWKELIFEVMTEVAN